MAHFSKASADSFLELKRYEFKYFITEAQYQEIRQAIDPFIQPDAFAAAAPLNRYLVHSLYLESPSGRYYEEKVEGKKERHKIRVRCYTENFYDSDLFYWEIKRKDLHTISKSRVQISKAELDYLLARNFFSCPEHLLNGNVARRKIAEELLYYCNRHALSPKVFVLYEREAYYSPVDDTIRLTFDRNVLSSLYYTGSIKKQLAWMPAFPRNRVIFEIKIRGFLPFWLHEVIKKQGLAFEAISKYCGSVDSSILHYL